MEKKAHIPLRLLTLCLVLMMLTGTASAEGLFPSMNQLFGTAMPSIGAALGRTANETGENADGKYELYNAFSSDDYTTFGAYLAGAGAELESTEVTVSAITATINVRGASMHFIYDWNAQTGTAIYPAGTRPETEKENVKIRASMLPPMGGIMPSAQFAVNRKPDGEIADDSGITQVWSNFTDEDYSAFSIYLAQVGATLLQSQAEGGVLTAEIGLNARSFTFTYDWRTKTASVFYPSGISPEQEMWNTLKGEGSILPKMDTIGKDLPSMSQALSRLPDKMETLEDGSRQEIYSSFNEEDYNVFSMYLQTTGCTVDDYHVEDGSVIVIQLSNIVGTFNFTYDALRHIGTVIYPKGSRIEAAWTAPTVTPKPVATATPKPAQYFSQSECWSAAERYFMNMRWHNPSSVTIHGHTSTYDVSSNSYTFYIDYSAQVVAGGFKRSTYFITVNAATGQITFAFGSD